MEQADVLIIGSGIAGLSLALQLIERNEKLKVAIFTKASESDSNTRYAQGGIAGVRDQLNDSFEAHIQDTLKAGGGKCNPYIVRKIIETAPNCIQKLLDWGTNFTLDEYGKPESVLEGGHSYARIAHAKDATGHEIETTLLDCVEKTPQIKIHNHCTLDDLITNENICYGVVITDHIEQKKHQLYSQVVVLATGGCGQLFSYNTNPEIATGDGIAIAHKHGANISNMHFIQFHPTAFYEENNSPLFLISEAVRGAGAHIVNKYKERFVFKHDPRGELATRDIVTKAILQEMQLKQEKWMYLDCTQIPEKQFKSNFPTIASYLQQKNIDPKKELIPILPAAHYQCGGIDVNEFGESSIHRLYALGECSNTGMHGSNRLASNSLLEAIAFAGFAAEKIAQIHAIQLPEPTSIKQKPKNDTDSGLIRKMKEIMYKAAIIGAPEEIIKNGLQELDALVAQYPLEFENSNLSNQLVVSRLILEQKLENEKHTTNLHSQTEKLCK